MRDFKFSSNPRPRRILVITLRRLGDVLLTTPLARTLRHASPDNAVDMLVFRGTEGILAGNPDIAEIITVSEKPSFGEFIALVRRLWRRYDLAISTQSGDRPTLLAFVAGRRRFGIIDAAPGKRWKRTLLHHSVPSDLSVHRIVELFRLLAPLGIPHRPELVAPTGAQMPAIAPQGPYAVLHPNPKFRYKRWNAPGWRELVAGLAERSLQVVVTGAPDPDERGYLDSLWPRKSVLRVDGRLNWPQLTELMRGASVFVGTDTSMSHLAAATGCPTVAIYGPVDPGIMGPWPTGGLQQPWAHSGMIQRRGNVWVVQNPLPCLPCERLGCDGHLNSRAQCLDELTAAQVLVAVDAALLSLRPAAAAKLRPAPAARASPTRLK